VPRRYLTFGSGVALLIAVLALASACGNTQRNDTVTTPTPTLTAGEQPGTMRVLVYFLRGGLVAASSREVPHTVTIARAAIESLLAGPTARERKIGFYTDIPAGTQLIAVTLDDQVLTIELSQQLNHTASAEVAYTASQFASVKEVEIVGGSEPSGSVTRATFEDVAPAILVERPSPFEQVSSPLRVSGTANTFEATLQLELLSSTGKLLAEKTVTATFGTGTRGTFDATLAFSSAPGAATLVAFEYSAKNGSRINVIRIPLELR
jgi:germination protein M